MSRWDYLQLFPHFHFLPSSSCRTIMKLASSPVFFPAFSFPKHFLRLENLWMTILYRKSLCSIPCSILSITPSASYSISGNGITACPIRKLTNGNHGGGEGGQPSAMQLKKSERVLHCNSGLSMMSLGMTRCWSPWDLKWTLRVDHPLAEILQRDPEKCIWHSVVAEVRAAQFCGGVTYFR